MSFWGFFSLFVYLFVSVFTFLHFFNFVQLWLYQVGGNTLFFLQIQWYMRSRPFKNTKV